MERSADRRRTTHVIRQRPLARFWIVPYHTGWHLAHHVDMGIPWRRLPDLHRELVASGWVTPEIEYPSYSALWRALCSKPAAGVAAGGRDPIGGDELAAQRGVDEEGQFAGRKLVG
jgi:fatty acid desaturase